MIKKFRIKSGLSGAILLAICATSSQAEIHTQTIDPLGYRGSYGTITLDDWGVTGPQGVTARDYQVAGGFNMSNLGQIQRVETLPPDWRTPDSPINVMMPEFTPQNYSNASVDSSVNFYRWLYTTPYSEFNSMYIDKNGNYFVNRRDMNWGFFNTFIYHDTSASGNDGSTQLGVDSSTQLSVNLLGTATLDASSDTTLTASVGGADEKVTTQLQFQPYAISDATGWCGSVLASHPAALEKMSGQLKFGVAFDVYPTLDGVPGDEPMPNLIPDFVARSFGTIEVDVTTAYGDRQHFRSSAVTNNTVPETGEVSSDRYNKVSFHGAGVIPTGVWTSADSWVANPNPLLPPTRKLNPDGTWAVNVVDEYTPGAIWYANPFAGYAFILRADGVRILEAIDKQYYRKTRNVPKGALKDVRDL